MGATDGESSNPHGRNRFGTNSDHTSLLFLAGMTMGSPPENPPTNSGIGSSIYIE